MEGRPALVSCAEPAASCTRATAESVNGAPFEARSHNLTRGSGVIMEPSRMESVTTAAVVTDSQRDAPDSFPDEDRFPKR
jgi:hypothetical protein